jgi:hypothetical protein
MHDEEGYSIYAKFSKLQQTQEKEEQIELQILKIGVLVEFLKDLDHATHSSGRFSWHQSYQAGQYHQQHTKGQRE